MDSVARRRAVSLATFSIRARKIHVIHAPKLGGLEDELLTELANQENGVRGTAHPEKNRSLDFQARLY
jgi:hypothetical protein